MTNPRIIAQTNKLRCIKFASGGYALERAKKDALGNDSWGRLSEETVFPMMDSQEFGDLVQAGRDAMALEMTRAAAIGLPLYNKPDWRSKLTPEIWMGIGVGLACLCFVVCALLQPLLEKAGAL